MDEITERTEEEKKCRAKKKGPGGLDQTLAHDLALPDAAWQDLEAGVPEKAVAPRSLNAEKTSREPNPNVRIGHAWSSIWDSIGLLQSSCFQVL